MLRCAHDAPCACIRTHMTSTLTAIATFPSIERLMQFVEKTLQEDPDELPTSACDAQSKYHFFFKLNKSFCKNLPLQTLKTFYKDVTSLPKVAALIDSEEKKRFLMHLVAHHALIKETNGFRFLGCSSVANMVSMLNHSCTPNLYNYCVGKVEYGTTLVPIKKGDQIFISYLGANLLDAPKTVRQAELKTWGFECRCEKCKRE